MTAVRSRWSVIALASAALAVALAAGEVHSPLRVLVILWFVLVCPGMTIVRRLRIADPAAELTLALGLSVALATAIASIGLYSGLWSPGATLAALVVVAFAAVLAGAEVCGAYGTPAALAWRRRLQIAALPLLLGSAGVIAIRLVPLIR